MNLFRRKSIGELIARADIDTGGRLKRTLDGVSLTLLGVGAIIGAGIFVLSGTAAALNAGPAVVLAFLLTGATAILAGLCYAEFAALIPVAGSAYTYATVTVGEVIAWIIGWDLILEYGLGATTVAIGWSGYVVSLMHDFGVDMPCALTAASGTVIECAGGRQVTAILNLPACMIVIAAMFLNIRGTRESAIVNNIAVFVKLAVIVIFVLAAAKAVVPAHWHPFIPPSEGGNRYGWDGIVSGAGLLFFGLHRI